MSSSSSSSYVEGAFILFVYTLSSAGLRSFIQAANIPHPASIYRPTPLFMSTLPAGPVVTATCSARPLLLRICLSTRPHPLAASRPFHRKTEVSGFPISQMGSLFFKLGAGKTRTRTYTACHAPHNRFTPLPSMSWWSLPTSIPRPFGSAFALSILRRSILEMVQALYAQTSPFPSTFAISPIRRL